MSAARPVSVLPTLLTLGNLACGLGAVLVAGSEQTHAGWSPIEMAAGLIVLAMVFDAVDGLAARAMQAATEFGAQLDSLADMVSFGVAPAVLLVEHSPWRAGLPFQLTIAAAVLFACCVALRLARYNTEAAAEAEQKDFAGLPSPAAAALVVALVIFIPLNVGTLALPAAYVALGLLMVSSIPYPHAVRWLARQRLNTRGIALLVAGIAMALAARQWAIPLVVGSYVAVPPL
ncbi:MAG: CDP-diacylglycerol--serine O-phosphatidyltransferase, partial [Planctomycetota bacterium]